MKKIITDKAIKNRQYWIEEIRNLSGNFGDDSDKLEKELETEIKKNGISSLIDHLRLCGNIPESYGHDTSEEKLYSKYTDCLLSLAYSSLGLKSLVLKERAQMPQMLRLSLKITALLQTQRHLDLVGLLKIKKTLKCKLCTAGNVGNLMQWWFVQYINCQPLQVKFISKLQHKMCVFLHIHI